LVVTIQINRKLTYIIIKFVLQYGIPISMSKKELADKKISLTS